MERMRSPMLEFLPTASNSLKPTLGALSPLNEQLQINSAACFCVITHRQRGSPVASLSLESMELICALNIKAFSSQQLRQMQKGSYFLLHSASWISKTKTTGC